MVLKLNSPEILIRDKETHKPLFILNSTLLKSVELNIDETNHIDFYVNADKISDNKVICGLFDDYYDYDISGIWTEANKYIKIN